MKYGYNFIFLPDDYLVCSNTIHWIHFPTDLKCHLHHIQNFCKVLKTSVFLFFCFWFWFEWKDLQVYFWTTPGFWIFFKKNFKVAYNHQYPIQMKFLYLLHEFVITKLASVSLSVLHTTFKYYEHFSLPAVTTPNYICYISLNHLAVLFAAPLYSWCLHLTSCSEVTIIVLGEAQSESLSSLSSSCQKWALISI